jgi:hypothetical protein
MTTWAAGMLLMATVGAAFAGCSGLSPAAARASGEGSLASPPTSAATFMERCALPGIVRCFGFDSEEEIAAYVRGGAATPIVDTSIKASGGGSLKMTIPARAGANTSGFFAMNFTPGTTNQTYASGDPRKGPAYYSIQFGEGEEFYVQWRQRFTPEFLATKYAGGGGWKQIVIGEGDRAGFRATSCTQLELVVNNGSNRGFPQMYHSCGAKDGRYEGLTDTVPRLGRTTPDHKLQNAIAGCLYSSPRVPPCVGYKADKWMTFQMRVKIGTWYRNDKAYHHDSEVDLWVADEGQRSRLVISMRDYDLANQNPMAKYGKVWLMPYNTGRDPNVTYAETYTWYDDLIVSRVAIPDPPPISSGASS